MQLAAFSLLLLTSWLVTEVCECSPVVTLTHGGQLRGFSTTYNNQPVDLFLGVRYAQPPIGDLRFKKSEQMAGWQGIVNATSSGSLCTQNTLDGSMQIGQEDCLFLDITVPGNAQPGAKKPVMVWIHGGAYNSGTGTTYIGGPLATAGDVIVVSMNYRLGIFGFLSDGPGTGNYGLWDQRAALIWVKENIEQFGGDPDLVTIFGESAGAGSVAAQTVGQHNDGLFKRAIQQSGSLFQPWSWYLSVNGRQQVVNSIRQNTNCTAPGKVYECLRYLSTAELGGIATTDPFNLPWKPVPDDYFFPENFEEIPTYELSKRFDLLAGMNGQEGVIELFFELGAFAAYSGRSIVDGASLDLARDYLKHLCTSLTPMSAELCADYLLMKYRLDRTRSDKERAIRLSYILGEINYDVDIVNQLRQHSACGKSTYAYYFTERYDLITDNPVYTSTPSWLKHSAAHNEELPFLFGAAFLKEESSPLWEELVGKEWLINGLLNQTLSSYHKPLSRKMMQLWTNFARTGNPNTPTKPAGYPSWPQFKKASEEFMNFNRWSLRVMNTPNEQRLDDLMNQLLVDRNHQVKADECLLNTP